MSDKVVLICLAVWALLFGLLTVTNVKMELMTPIMGLAAIVCGVVCLIKAFK